MTYFFKEGSSWFKKVFSVFFNVFLILFEGYIPYLDPEKSFQTFYLHLFNLFFSVKVDLSCICCKMTQYLNKFAFFFTRIAILRNLGCKLNKNISNGRNFLSNSSSRWQNMCTSHYDGVKNSCKYTLKTLKCTSECIQMPIIDINASSTHNLKQTKSYISAILQNINLQCLF